MHARAHRAFPRRPFTRAVLAALLCAAALAASACGVGNPTEGITSREGQARNAQAVSSLQQALITAGTVGVDGGASGGGSLAAELQSRDPNNAYGSQPPTGPGAIQVLGGEGSPLLLVAYSAGDGGAPGYVAAWQGGGTTRWYAGSVPPAYSSSEPAGTGWSANAPTATGASSATPVSTGSY